MKDFLDDVRRLKICFRPSIRVGEGEGHNLRFMFSSGQRRAVGLAFLLSICLSRPWCALESIVLDDPVQHIDDYRALHLVEALAGIRQTGYQVICTVEDIELGELLARRLRSTIESHWRVSYAAVQFGRWRHVRADSTGTALRHSDSEIRIATSMSLDVVEGIVNTTRLLEQFWRQAHGWAPVEVSNQLGAARLDRQLSFADTLRDYLQPFPKKQAEARQILGYATLRSLCEGVLKLFFVVYLLDYRASAP